VSHYGLAILAGFLTVLSPCILPIVPVVVGSALRRNSMGPVVVCLGLALSFAVFGGFVFSFGSSVGLSPKFVRNISAILLCLFAIPLISPAASALLARALTPLSSKVARFSQDNLPDSLWGDFLGGALLGLIWSPCSGPTLGATIALASSQGLTLSLALILFCLGAGASLPLLAVAYISRGVISRRANIIAGSKFVTQLFGVIIFTIGILTLSGTSRSIEAFVLGFIPDWISAIAVKF